MNPNPPSQDIVIDAPRAFKTKYHDVFQDMPDSILYCFTADELTALIESYVARAKKPVIDVWTIHGRAPEYHRKMQLKLKQEWPVLYNAIQELVKESHEPK